MATQIRKTTAETEIRDLINAWLKDVLARDLDKIMSHYAPDVLAFDAIAALQFKGVAAYRKHWQACFEMCPGDMIFEMHDLGIEMGEPLAVAHYLCRCGGTDANGEQKTSWMRATVCLRRQDGTWAIAHEHYSAPFDPASGKALFDAQP